jgi:hypothetical protein
VDDVVEELSLEDDGVLEPLLEPLVEPLLEPDGVDEVPEDMLLLLLLEVDEFIELPVDELVEFGWAELDESFVVWAYARPTAPTMVAAATAVLRVLETFTEISLRR